jgi:ribonuclease BN (tRNA processing enzyme)
LSHLHWDHVQGLPFFVAGDRDDAVVALRLPHEGEPAADTLSRSMSPPHFPIGPEGLRGSWTFDSIDEGSHHIEGFEVLAREIPHKGGRTFGYRISDRTGSTAYLPDHRTAADGPGREAALELARGVDLLVHDAQFLPGEAAPAAAFGHSRIDEVIALAEEAEVGRLVLFHHAPARTDDALDDVVSSIAASLPAGMAMPLLATEGATVAVTSGTPTPGPGREPLPSPSR